jgi:Predicted permease
MTGKYRPAPLAAAQTPTTRQKPPRQRSRLRNWLENETLHAGSALSGEFRIKAMSAGAFALGPSPSRAMAAVLWGSGVSFGGVLAFLYADLIVLPLLDVYRRYYGWKMAAYIAAVFYATMVIAALIMDAAFNAIGWTPQSRPDMHAEMVHFSMNYTFWLNVAFGLLAITLFAVVRRHPMEQSRRS